MAVRRVFFTLNLLLTLFALFQIITANSDTNRRNRTKGLLYFKVKTSLCNIEPDGNGFLWYICYDKFTRRHAGLSRRITFMSTLKSRCTTTLQMTLLLISGNVSPNPGPVKDPCSVCTKPVAANHKALLCDKCTKWCHIGPKCGKVKVKDYKKYVEKESFEWICPKCSELNRLPSQQQVEQRRPRPRPRPSHQETITSNLQSGDTNIEAYDDLKENIKGPWNISWTYKYTEHS